MSQLKTNLQNNKVTKGGWIQIGHPAIIEILDQCGLDFVCIDLEHGCIGFETACDLIRTANGLGIDILVRVPLSCPTWISRCLDAGADGIIVPRLQSIEEVHQAINYTKYPPIGERGFGWSRANKYGAIFDTYTKTANQDTVLIIQIEHVEALNQLGSILSLDAVDGTMIGPLDLKGSIDSEMGSTCFEAMLQRYLEVCSQFRKPAGIHILESIKHNTNRAITDGYKFIIVSTDARMLSDGVNEALWD